MSRGFRGYRADEAEREKVFRGVQNTGEAYTPSGVCQDGKPPASGAKQDYSALLRLTP
jgi:hypothetical protein